MTSLRTWPVPHNDPHLRIWFEVASQAQALQVCSAVAKSQIRLEADSRVQHELTQSIEKVQSQYLNYLYRANNRSFDKYNPDSFY